MSLHKINDIPNTPNFRDNLLIGMGNPLLDISTNVDKEFLAKYELKENDAILADEKHKNLYTYLTDNHQVEYIAGGSVQNALRVAQWLIGKPKVTTFFGCVGEDKFGKILYDRASEDGVNVRYQYSEKEPTGTCAVLITDHNRSLCANLGSANCFTIDHIEKPENRMLLESAQFFYISVSYFYYLIIYWVNLICTNISTVFTLHQIKLLFLFAIF